MSTDNYNIEVHINASWPTENTSPGLWADMSLKKELVVTCLNQGNPTHSHGSKRSHAEIKAATRFSVYKQPMITEEEGNQTKSFSVSLRKLAYRCVSEISFLPFM